MKLFCNFLILFIFNVSLSKAKHKKGMKGKERSEGDKLIEIILSADGFNVLADKIVEKAIWKLNHLNSSSEYTPKIEKNSAQDSRTNVREDRSNKKDHKHHKTAIDVEAVLKKAVPLSALMFRFDHFVKGPNSLVGKSAKNKDEPKRYSSYGNTEDNLAKSNIKKSSEYNSEARNDNNKHQKDRSEETFILNKEKDQAETTTNKDEFNVPKMASAENQFGDEKEIVWGKKDKSSGSNSEERDEKTEKTMNKDNDIEDNESYRNRAVSENRTLTSSSKNDEDSNRINDLWKDQETGVKQLQIEHDEIQKKNKHLIRREGGKTYTFEESPDYNEYHEKLSEMLKTQINQI